MAMRGTELSDTRSRRPAHRSSPHPATDGISPDGGARVLAGLLEVSPRPFTALAEALSGRRLRARLTGSGETLLDDQTAARLGAEPGTPARWRTAELHDGVTTAAVTELCWLPDRVPPAALAALESGIVPAGTALAPHKMRRADRRALAYPGAGVAVRSSAVLVLPGRGTVAVAREQVTAGWLRMVFPGT